MRHQRPRYRHRHDGGDDHRRQRRQRIGADHQFERIERPRERRIERRRDRPRGPAPHQQPQIVPPNPKAPPGAGSQRRPDLRIARLKPYRGPHPVGPHRLAHHDQAGVQGHAPAMQRIRFDRVDGAPVPPLRQRQPGKPQPQPPQRRHQQRVQQPNLNLGGQPLMRADIVQHLMHPLRHRAHRDDAQARSRPNESRQHRKPKLVGPHQGSGSCRRMADPEPDPAPYPRRRPILRVARRRAQYTKKTPQRQMSPDVLPAPGKRPADQARPWQVGNPQSTRPSPCARPTVSDGAPFQTSTHGPAALATIYRLKMA